MKVRFTENYDYTPTEEPRITVAFRADGGPLGDGTYTVRKECGQKAVAAGKAEDLTFNGADPAKFDHDQDGAAGGAARPADEGGAGDDDQA